MTDILKASFYYLFKNKEGYHIRDDKSGIDIFLFEKEGYQIINILGSCEIKDWITDFKFLLKTFTPRRKPKYARKGSRVKCHGGFLSGWERIREIVLDKVNSNKVIVTGFSMGAGISQIVALDIQYNKNPEELYCYSYEGPKIWNKYGMESFNDRVPFCQTYSYGNSIVSKIPPFYYSGGTNTHIGEERKWYKLSIIDHLYLLYNKDLFFKEIS